MMKEKGWIKNQTEKYRLKESERSVTKRVEETDIMRERERGERQTKIERKRERESILVERQRE